MRFRDVDYSHALSDVRKAGWATANGSLDDVRQAAGSLGWEEMSFRKGDPPVTDLRPFSQVEARPRSLSAEFGLGEFPLHTDGAHLLDPPDIVVLHSQNPSAIGTLLWTMPSLNWTERTFGVDLDQGVFLVRNGRASFFASALIRDGIRYDPGCMVPCDQRARLIAEKFDTARLGARIHRWDRSDGLLFIDNRRTLHGRGSVEPVDDERVLQRVGFRRQRF